MRRAAEPPKARAMADLVLLRPLWLLALLPIAALALWRRYALKPGRWSALIDPQLLPALRELGVLIDGSGARLLRLPFLAAAFAAVALSGPAQLRPGSTEFRVLDPMILILDLSPSVVGARAPLEELQFAAAELVALAAGRPVGLMVYAADAYLAQPPSSDPAGLEGLIAVLTRDTMPIAGSRPDIALSMARDFFATEDGAGLVGADLVLISDGGGASLRANEEAARLASEGARVWALALPASAEGAPLANPKALEDLAIAGGGSAVAAGQASELSERIARSRTARLARMTGSATSFRDYGPWLLPLAMLALLPLFRRRQ